MFLRGQRSNLGVNGFRISSNQRFGGSHKTCQELVVDLPLDVQAATGEAHLPGIGEDGPDRPAHRAVEVGVGEDQVGTLSAQFQAYRGQVGRRRRRDGSAGTGFAGEGDPVNAGIAGERGSHRIGTISVHDIQDAIGHPGLQGKSRQDGRRRGSVLGRFEDDRVSPREGGATFHVSSISGKFHGAIAATTPAGSNLV